MTSLRTLRRLLAVAPSTAAARGAAGAAFAAVAGLGRGARASARGVLTLTSVLIRLFHGRSPVVRRAPLPALTDKTQGAPPHYTLTTFAWHVAGQGCTADGMHDETLAAEDLVTPQ